MVALVPFTLDHVLDAVVEAGVRELVAARQELASVRAAAATAREVLEARNRVLEGELEGARRRIAELEAAPAFSPDELPTGPVRLSPPRIAVEKGEVIPSNEGAKPAPAPRQQLAARDFAARPSEDLTNERVGSYACEGRTGIARADGRAIWRFRCEYCKAPKDYTVNDVRRIRKHHPHTTCPCQKAAAGPQRARIVDRTGLELGLFTCSGGNGAEGGDRRWIFHCRECKARLALTSNQVSNHVSGSTTPRCVACEPDRRGGRKPAAPPPEEATEAREERPLDLDFSELDAIDGGRGDDGLDGLLEQSMRDAEGDGRLRTMAAFGDREREERDEDAEDEDEGDDDDDDDQEDDE